MNKTELKIFAVSARRDLLEKVALRAKIFGIDAKSDLTIEEQFGQLVINGNTYPLQMKSRFQSLANQLKTKGYEQLIEEVAYTWFNRIIAIRYMEVTDYLPERVNVLSSSTGKVEPDILSEFEMTDLNIDVVTIKDLIKQGETEEAYRKLFIAQCNALNSIFPFMFEQIQDYTEWLLPDFLLDSESVINQLVSNESLTESFTEVEVIGWLYQFYNSEPKDKVFANLKKSKKIEKYDIPAATQLFTPKWIVQYMVENSLGQLWLEANPESSLKQSMHYYIEPAEQDEEVKQKLEEIRYQNVNLEEITIMDPCVGSGHILVYAFDLLYQMYEEAGYPSGDIPQLILEKNLYGLDIDDRAAQLASFALMMKAREKSRRIFRKKITLNILSIKESNSFNRKGIIQLLCESEKDKQELSSIFEDFIDAKTFGSILQPSKIDTDKYLKRIDHLEETQLTLDTYESYEQINDFRYLMKQLDVLTTQYDVIVTNPPYMGFGNMNSELKNRVNKMYSTSKNDLFSVFMARGFSFLKDCGFNTLVTMQSWMSLSSYERFRKEILLKHHISSLLHMESMVMGIAFGTSATVFRKLTSMDYKGAYTRINLEDLSEKNIPRVFPIEDRLFNKTLKQFLDIPNFPIIYSLSDNASAIFKKYPTLNNYGLPREGMATANNDLFLRLWHEVPIDKIGFNFKSREESNQSKLKWFPYNKGGDFKRWYGNNYFVVNWENDGFDIKNFKDENGRVRSHNYNLDYIFKEGITWTALSSGNTSFRYSSKGFLFDSKGSTLFPTNRECIWYILGFLNSAVSRYFLNYISPTMDFKPGHIGSIPFVYKNNPNVERISKEIVNSYTENWDFSEISWDFRRHPILTYGSDHVLLSKAFQSWVSYSDLQFENLKVHEEELNRIFIYMYDLQEELTEEIPNEDITIHRANRSSDARTFISYFIGCLMGRYSLDAEGLTFAGGEWNNSKYQVFIPGQYGLIQLTDEYYFENDIIARLREFLSVTFGTEAVEENVQWLAESLKLKRNETAEERLRRYFLDEFFKDHCQLYQKRPIYWLVDSGKQKGLRTLIYMHRYQPDTMAIIRFEHLQEIQAKYNNEIAAVDLRVVNSNLSATEKRDLEKRKIIYQKRLEELLEFDKKLAEYANAQIAIDLDDGVKVNYAKFHKVLAKIK
ncbi:BREX-1 system adenine-specific DNA-methyltransferase PglX [Bacillus sp. V3B]|uniref:BREX-1 system adenine-specific DNA-methyltransferase PglX n=1 Tax=Bacillus sp. V3B TaxID=2804915 RepID=UPI00210995C9|nr:BREX-1 system adenine-specific DNA-methyltransferase PglX [Bacillus sp. V3B]MCQ6274790.1 BREX-1 system adenine-specific DNA-methyltransferase PglX [Bacillus sp. V3B]